MFLVKLSAVNTLYNYNVMNIPRVCPSAGAETFYFHCAVAVLLPKVFFNTNPHWLCLSPSVLPRTSYVCHDRRSTNFLTQDSVSCLRTFYNGDFS